MKVGFQGTKFDKSVLYESGSQAGKIKSAPPKETILKPSDCDHEDPSGRALSTEETRG